MRAKLRKLIGITARGRSALPCEFALSGVQHDEREPSAGIEQFPRISARRHRYPQRSRIMCDLRKKTDRHGIPPDASLSQQDPDRALDHTSTQIRAGHGLKVYRALPAHSLVVQPDGHAALMRACVDAMITETVRATVTPCIRRNGPVGCEVLWRGRFVEHASVIG